MRWYVPVLLAILLGNQSTAAAQDSIDAKWIWFNETDPATSATPGKVWFRREVRAAEPSTGAVKIACDDQFVLWVNGERIGDGGGEKSYRFNLNGIVGRGINVVCIEATNKSGRAGLFVDGEIRGQSGRPVSFDSGADWHATRRRPVGETWLAPRYMESDWTTVKVIGSHAASPWKSIAFPSSYLDRYELAPGFELERIGEPDLVGSLVAMTWGNRGRLIASRERGPILSVIDDNGDGTFDRVVEYSKKVTNCQGLCMVFDDLFAVGIGPDGTGMYRLPDRDGDDRADAVELITKHQGGIGEHGPHDVVFGPDGWMYHNMGNHAHITSVPEPNSPVRRPYEGDLLRPRFEDARGHASGIKVPGGTIWRFTPDGKRWWLEVNGFRNEYDFALNRLGDLFTFDSDMEWDVGLPWYRPVRVNHCTAGAEFGWRSGAAKWPDYYFDSLPSVTDIGRGSPTGVVFYEHEAFPEKYRGSFIVCDWSVGRIIAVFLHPEGGTYGGKWENLVTGNPLNVSDIDVDRDGSIVFTTGGRNTEGGIYRIRHAKSQAVRPIKTESLEDALTMPQIHAAWAREAIEKIKKKLGSQWQVGLTAAARSGKSESQIRALTLLSQFGPKPKVELLAALTRDEDANVRAFAAWLLGSHSSPAVGAALEELLADPDPAVVRRACEAIVRSGSQPPADALVRLLGSPDRSVRFAARLAIERLPADFWLDRVLESRDAHIVTHGLLAYHRASGLKLLADQRDVRGALELLQQRAKLSEEQQVNVMRLVELFVLGGAEGSYVDAIGAELAQHFPTGHVAVDMETSRLMAALDVPGAAEAILTAMEKSTSHPLQIHFALCLRYIRTGWNADLTRRLFQWYEQTRDWEGGHSFQPYVANIMAGTIPSHAPDSLKSLLAAWREHPFVAEFLLQRVDPDQIADHASLVEGMLTALQKNASSDGERMLEQAVNSLGKNSSARAQEFLRKMYDEQPDRRGLLAQNLARHPNAENWPYMLRNLQFGDNNTLQVSVRALRRIDRKADKPSDIRAVILAGLELGDQGGIAAADLLQQWTGSKHQAGKNAAKALAHYQTWFKESYPNEPAPELPKADAAKSKYSYRQLLRFLTRDARGRRGDPEKGKLVFTKANCVKCHRFLKEGEGIGPDLTTVRRRFQKKEIVESMIYPSKVISDQYRGVTVVTADGLVYTGLAASQPDSPTLVLVTPEAKRVEIARSDVEQMTPSRTSVMPEGALNELSLDEIADLFAFLETSRFNSEPAAASNATSGSDGR